MEIEGFEPELGAQDVQWVCTEKHRGGCLLSCLQLLWAWMRGAAVRGFACRGRSWIYCSRFSETVTGDASHMLQMSAALVAGFALSTLCSIGTIER